MVIIALVIAASGVQAARLPADVTVSDVDCREGEIVGMELTVEYLDSEPVVVTPHVWGTRSHVQLSWDPTTIRLEPGTNTVEIEPPRPRGRIKGDYAQVYLTHEQQRATTNWRTESCRS